MIFEVLIDTIYPIAIGYIFAGLILSTVKTVAGFMRCNDFNIYRLKHEITDWLLGVLLWPFLGVK